MTLFEAEMEALALRAEALRRARERATPDEREALDAVEAQIRADVRRYAASTTRGWMMDPESIVAFGERLASSAGSPRQQDPDEASDG